MPSNTVKEPQKSTVKVSKMYDSSSDEEDDAEEQRDKMKFNFDPFDELEYNELKKPK
jgi:hypothetical protein